jgi:hypothetical protein
VSSVSSPVEGPLHVGPLAASVSTSGASSARLDHRVSPAAVHAGRSLLLRRLLGGRSDVLATVQQRRSHPRIAARIPRRFLGRPALCPRAEKGAQCQTLLHHGVSAADARLRVLLVRHAMILANVCSLCQVGSNGLPICLIWPSEVRVATQLPPIFTTRRDKWRHRVAYDRSRSPQNGTCRHVTTANGWRHAVFKTVVRLRRNSRGFESKPPAQ